MTTVFDRHGIGSGQLAGRPAGDGTGPGPGPGSGSGSGSGSGFGDQDRPPGVYAVLLATLAWSTAALGWLGRHGMALPFAALLLGLAVPSLAAAAGPALIVAAPAVIMIGVMLAEVGRPPARERRTVLALAALPAVLSTGWFATIGAAGLPPELGWAALVAAAPIASAAVLAARAIGQPIRPLVLGQLLSFLPLPLLLPPLLERLTPGCTLDDLALLGRLLLLVLLPVAAGWMLRRPAARAPAGLPPALRGAATLGLMAVGLAAARAIPLALGGVGEVAPAVLAAVGAVLLAGAGAAALVGSRMGRGAAGSFAMAGGCRNLSIVWVAAAPWLPPAGVLSLSAALVVTFALPAVVAAAQLARRAGRRSLQKPPARRI